MITIKEEGRAHWAGIAALNMQAFGGNTEAELVERLYREDRVVLSLVALDDNDSVVGHILFSAIDLEVDGHDVRAVALAPMSVDASHQRQGIGGRLITEGLAKLTQKDWDAVIVLGHPAYYPRFGFSASLAQKLAAPFSGDAFMALELKPGALAGTRGSVRYADAFGAQGSN